MSNVTNPVMQSEESENTKVWLDKRREAIRISVLRALGRPPEMIRVSVLPLWGDKFRVNVWATGSNGAAIPDSYFVTATEDGTIQQSDPPIQKRY